MLDTTITPELVLEGISRELVSKIQNMRKEAGFEIVDKIHLYCLGDDTINKMLRRYGKEIKKDTLALSIEKTSPPKDAFTREWNLNGYNIIVGVKKQS